VGEVRRMGYIFIVVAVVFVLFLCYWDGRPIKQNRWLAGVVLSLFVLTSAGLVPAGLMGIWFVCLASAVIWTIDKYRGEARKA
jgi:hypothetical protein